MEFCDLTGNKPHWTAEHPPHNEIGTAACIVSTQANTSTHPDGLQQQSQQHSPAQPFEQSTSDHIRTRSLEQVSPSSNSNPQPPGFATVTATSAAASSRTVDTTPQAARYSNLPSSTWARTTQHRSGDRMRYDNLGTYSGPYSRGRSAPHASAESGSWGNTRSDSSGSGSHSSYRDNSRQSYHHHSSSYGNPRSSSPYYNQNGYQAYRNRSPRGGGGRYGGSNNRNAGSGSGRPGSAGNQPCWVKQGGWLVPRSGCGTVTAAVARAAGNSTASQGHGLSTEAQGVSSISIGRDKVVVIMRGLPGSGKSTRAAQIAAEAQATAAAAAGTVAAIQVANTAAAAMNLNRSAAADPVVAIHSTDSYFINHVTGVYTFDFEQLSNNHQLNYEAFCASLAAGVLTVIVDNTNIQPWQFERYVTAAWAAGYKVKEEVVGEFTEAAAARYAERNVHGVPHDKIIMMLDQWRRQ